MSKNRYPLYKYIIGACELIKDVAPKALHEDNAACIKQVKDGYLKVDGSKHILPKNLLP